MARSVAPWTPEQVAGLAAWQACGWVHPFTCQTDHPEGRGLIPTPDGWVCHRCTYRQNWAHDFMLKGAPPDPIEALRAQRSPS